MRFVRVVNARIFFEITFFVEFVPIFESNLVELRVTASAHYVYTRWDMLFGFVIDFVLTKSERVPRGVKTE